MATSERMGDGMAKRRSKTQAAILQDLARDGACWFHSDRTSYGRRKLDAAHALRDEGLVRLEHQGDSYRVFPASIAMLAARSQP